MDLDARPYRCFVAVAENGSFSRAAASMHISQPALSAQVSELERRLGFKLFSRTSRRVELTAQGFLFLDNARRLIRETEWINQAAKAIRSNDLHIGAAHHSLLIPERRRLIEQFVLNHRDISMNVTGLSHAQLYAELNRRQIDIALTIELDVEHGRSSAVEPETTAEFERLVLGRKPVNLMVPVESTLGLGGEISPEELQGATIMSINRSHGVALSEAVRLRLIAAGTIAIQPPEGDALSVARYGNLMRTPAVSLGWFPDGSGELDYRMRICAAPSLNLATCLVLLRCRRSLRPAAQRFWDMAGAFAGDGGQARISEFNVQPEPHFGDETK